MLNQAQEWTSDILAELKQEGNGSTEQYQLPLLPVVIIDEVLDCSAEQLSRLICQPDAHFQATIHKLAGNNDLQQGTWHQQGKWFHKSDCHLLALCIIYIITVMPLLNMQILVCVASV